MTIDNKNPLAMLQFVYGQLNPASTKEQASRVFAEFQGRSWQVLEVLKELEKQAHASSRTDLLAKCREIRECMQKASETSLSTQEKTPSFKEKVVSGAWESLVNCAIFFGEKSSINADELRENLRIAGISEDIYEHIHDFVILILKKLCEDIGAYQDYREKPSPFISFFYTKNSQSYTLNTCGQQFVRLCFLQQNPPVLNEKKLSSLSGILEVLLVRFLVNLSKAADAGLVLPIGVEDGLRQQMVLVSEKKENISFDLQAMQLADFVVSVGLPSDEGLASSFEKLAFILLKGLLSGCLKKFFVKNFQALQNTVLGKTDLFGPMDITGESQQQKSTATEKVLFLSREENNKLSMLLGSTLASFAQLQSDSTETTPLPFFAEMFFSTMLRGLFKPEYFKVSIDQSVKKLKENNIVALPEFIKKTVPVLLQYTKEILASCNKENFSPPGKFAHLFTQVPGNNGKTQFVPNWLGQPMEKLLSEDSSRKGIESYVEAAVLTVLSDFIEKIKSPEFMVPGALFNQNIPSTERVQRVVDFIIHELLPSQSNLILVPLFDALQPILYDLLSVQLQTYLPVLFNIIDMEKNKLPTTVAKKITEPLCEKAKKKVLHFPGKESASIVELQQPEVFITTQTRASLVKIFGTHFLKKIKEFAPLCSLKLIKSEEEPLIFQGIHECETIILQQQLKKIKFHRPDAANVASAVEMAVFESVGPKVSLLVTHLLQYVTDSLSSYEKKSAEKPERQLSFLVEGDEKAGYSLSEPGRHILLSLQSPEAVSFIVDAATYTVSSLCSEIVKKIRAGTLLLLKELFDPNAPDREKKISAFLLEFLPSFDTIELPFLLEDCRDVIRDVLVQVLEKQVGPLISLLDTTLEQLPQIIERQSESKKQDKKSEQKELIDDGVVLGVTVGKHVLDAMTFDKKTRAEIQNRIEKERTFLCARGLSAEVIDVPRHLISHCIDALEQSLRVHYDGEMTPPVFLQKSCFKIGPDGNYILNEVGSMLLDYFNADNKKFVTELLEANFLTICSNVIQQKNSLNTIDFFEQFVEKINLLFKTISVTTETKGNFLSQAFVGQNGVLFDNLVVPYLFQEVAPLFTTVFSTTLSLGCDIAISVIDDKVILPLVNRTLYNIFSGIKSTQKFLRAVFARLKGDAKQHRVSQGKINSVADKLYVFFQNFFPDLIIPKVLVKEITAAFLPYLQVSPVATFNAVLFTLKEKQITSDVILALLQKKTTKRSFVEGTPEEYIREVLRSKKEKREEKIRSVRFGFEYMRLRIKAILYSIVSFIVLWLFTRTIKNLLFPSIEQRIKVIVILITQVLNILITESKGMKNEPKSE